MPDYNPDKEGHVQHKYIVQDATRDRLAGVQTSKGQLDFDRNGRLLVNDPTLANEIRTSEAGKRDVTVTRVRWQDSHERGHRYHFGQMPELPWKRKEREERERREREAQQEGKNDGNSGGWTQRTDDGNDRRD